MEIFIHVTFALFLLIISVIDIKTRMIYNKILLPMLIVGITLDYFCVLVPLEEALINSALGFLITFAIMKFSGGLGGGDVKFCAVLGVWLGYDLFSAIFTASILAAVVGIFFALKFRNLKFELPFGPFLSLGAWLVFEFDIDFVKILLC